MQMTKSVAVLGCGPSGLLVAHAADMSGWDFHIYSRKQKSQLFGAQYLHKAIPNLNVGSPRLIRYTLTGTSEEYRQKVYGDSWEGSVSPEDLMEEHLAWDIRKAYDILWDLYQDEVNDVSFDPNEIGEYSIKNTTSYVTCGHDLVISTIPRKVWAEEGDVFESQKIWAYGDVDTIHTRVFKYRPAPFTVVCDGTLSNRWYRVSNIFGYATMEWPWFPSFWNINGYPPMTGASLVEKPLRHNSKAAKDFVHLGRYGAWQKGQLTSDVFYQAREVFENDRFDYSGFFGMDATGGRNTS